EHVRGAAHARNRGLAEASGTVVVFIDDDVNPADDWLARLTEPILAGRCEATGGKVVLDPAVPRPPWFIESWMGGYLAAFERGPAEVPIAPDDFVITASAAFQAGAVRAPAGLEPGRGPRRGAPPQGTWRPSVAFQAACDVARAAGRLRESAWAIAGRRPLRPAPQPTPLP